MFVDIDRVRAMRAELRDINKTDLKDIIWVSDGDCFKFPEAIEDELVFTGLNNVDHMEMFEQDLEKIGSPYDGC